MEMVNITPLCVATLLATCNPSETEIATTEGDSVQQSTYDSVDSQQISEWLEKEAMVSSLYNPRNVLKPEVVNYLVGYQEYQEEQERLAELERQRIAEEQARLEEQRRQEQIRQQELERQRALEQQYPYKNYRQTYYSVQEGERSLGAGYNVNSSEVAVINNIMNFYDKQYGYLPIVAININEVMASGLNQRGTPNLYGSVIEMKYPNGNVQKAIVLDACGACSRSSKVDLWVYNNDSSLDISGVEFRYVRKGW